MEITKFDIMILIVMSLAVVSMSFVFPELGMAGVDTDQSDIPTLDVDSERFNLAGDAPRQPSSPTEGTLYFDTTQSATFSENTVWLNGTTQNGVQMTLLQNTSDNSHADVLLSQWSGGSVVDQDRVVLTENDTTGVVDAAGYQIGVQTTDRHDPPDLLDVSWNVSEDPRDDGMFSVLGDIAEVVAWATVWFIWFCTFIVQFSLNAVGGLFDVTNYMIDTLVWLITTYGSIIGAADSWVSIFVAIPGIILSATLAKIVAVGVNLLPTT